MENKLFIDTNIFLDLLLKRGGFGEQANTFFSTCIDQKIHLLTSVSCVQTIIYILQKTGCTRGVVINSVAKINELVAMANTSSEDINKAIKSDFIDLEDAILYYTAISNGCDVLITQNVKDFPKSNEELAVLKPNEF